MPITPSYTWHESATWVTIHVALCSVSPANIDILTTDCYVKVNCLPYFFQVDLYGDIESKKSSALVDNNVVRFFLVKKDRCLWGRLHAVGEKKEIIAKRERSLDLEREHSIKLKADAKVKFAQVGRLAVQSQMRLDEEKRNVVEERKANELKFEQEMIQSWQAKLGADLYLETRCSVPESLESKCISVLKDSEVLAIKDSNADGHPLFSDLECAEAAKKSHTLNQIQDNQPARIQLQVSPN